MSEKLKPVPGKRILYNPASRKWYYVDEDAYKEATRDLAVFLMRQKRAGICCCPQNSMWECDGDCICCKHFAADKFISLDAPIGDQDGDLLGHEVYTDHSMSTMDDYIEHKELMSALYAMLSSLPENEYIICKIIMEHKKDLEGMAMLKVTRNRYHRMKKRVLTKMKEALSEYRY